MVLSQRRCALVLLALLGVALWLRPTLLRAQEAGTGLRPMTVRDSVEKVTFASEAWNGERKSVSPDSRFSRIQSKVWCGPATELNYMVVRQRSCPRTS